MTSSSSISVLGSDFDDFLFAPLGEDRNDMPLSMVSALARLNIDPWQEADTLARLPRETAIQRLASLIAALPDGSPAHLDLGAIAARLIVRLPRLARSNIPSRGTLLSVGAMTSRRAIIHLILIYVILGSFMLGIEWIAASLHPSAPVDSAHVPASSTVLPQIPSLNSRR